MIFNKVVSFFIFLVAFIVLYLSLIIDALATISFASIEFAALVFILAIISFVIAAAAAVLVFFILELLS